MISKNNIIAEEHLLAELEAMKTATNKAQARSRIYGMADMAFLLGAITEKQRARIIVDAIFIEKEQETDKEIQDL